MPQWIDLDLALTTNYYNTVKQSTTSNSNSESEVFFSLQPSAIR